MTDQHRTGSGSLPGPDRCASPARASSSGARADGSGEQRDCGPDSAVRPGAAPRMRRPARPASPRRGRHASAHSVVPAVVLLLAATGLLVAGGAAALVDHRAGPSTATAASAPAPPAPPPPPPPPPQVQPAVVADTEPEAPPPRRVTVERVGLDADLVGLDVLADGTLEVPSDFDQAGWHRDGTVPGNRGPAVLVGHVDSYDGPAAFFGVRELTSGDLVTVTRADSSQVVFEVYAQEVVPKDQFPTDRVYGGTEGAELRLLTCGGTFDEQSRSYRDNVVVYARVVPAEVPQPTEAQPTDDQGPA